MKLLTIFLFFSCLASGYLPEQVSITDYEFRRYVKPQLKSISNDFQTLFFSLNSALAPLKSSYSEFRKINKLNQQIRTDCQSNELEGTCLEQVRALEKSLLSVSKTMSSIKEIDSKSVDAKLVFSNSKEMLEQSLARNIIRIQNLSFKSELTSSKKFDAGNFCDQINYLYDRFNTFLFKSSDERFKNEINSYWANFIRPVETYAIYRSNKEFFKKNINELNMRWNMLHVRLTKRGYKPNKQTSTLLNIMQRRWVNILKVSLKPRG
ncbi:MAG: hypothetical protein CME64_00630 [Halobacteriovoraceae bacterium]|nr:hypothetical protein [Halobacteriovoraceae bacterium]|tara:strand:+ start:145223 stop:146017 length:795 start_codon:yes stop_codon:yes gene_type:complete